MAAKQPSPPPTRRRDEAGAPLEDDGLCSLAHGGALTTSTLQDIMLVMYLGSMPLSQELAVSRVELTFLKATLRMLHLLAHLQ